MSNLVQNDLQSDLASIRTESTGSHRRRPLRVLFVHRDAEIIENCLEELKKAQFTVTADFVLNFAQGGERLHSQSYDVVVAEYPCPGVKGSQALQVLHQKLKEIPLLFVASAKGSESIEQLAAVGAFDYVERDRLAQLPLAVRQALNERELRDELEEARRALRHSQSLYRALVDNPAYGIYRCNAEGVTIDVNQALLTMLGYASKEELLAANLPTELLFDFDNGSSWAKLLPEAKGIEPVEIEKKRKDGTTLRARLSGRGVYDDNGNFAGYEIIVVDVTEQRTIEDQLRHQASSDSLTGLANHRRLFEVLHAEICRSNRTGREFSLVLLDLDGLKAINDEFGHLAGDRALCRLAEILRDCCRSIDTVARHGGDEFALVLPETGIAAATLVAHRICELLGEEAEKPALSVSVGIASHPKDAETIGTLLYAADRALYAMKDKRPRVFKVVNTSKSHSEVVISESSRIRE
ncbi:MAG TPA: diguanylate cyclase [Terriglobales bacterium]|jgi:diguanylate cyclase (GGDEF)-like protein/PAS domain S-box-containing protein|nr:diguanylate cyclase [Terriglobales bacterium]